MKTKEDRLPRWVSIGLVLAGIIAVMAVGYYFRHSETPAVQPIGQYNGREMSEKIDQDASVGILPAGFER